MILNAYSLALKTYNNASFFCALRIRSAVEIALAQDG
jgi:hypothetical protein